MRNLGVLPVDAHWRSTDDEATLVHAAQRDPAAFGELYQRYVPRIYRYLRTRTDTEDDAADLTQQVFLQALDALPRYRPCGVPFAAWLFQIARNVVIDAQRRRRQTLAWDLVPEALHPVDQHNPEGALLEHEALVQLRTLLVALDADKRELVTLYFVARLTLREIAVVVGKSEAAVQKALSRILHMLREQYHAE